MVHARGSGLTKSLVLTSVGNSSRGSGEPQSLVLYFCWKRGSDPFQLLNQSEFI
jgi:hypothetical protein